MKKSSKRILAFATLGLAALLVTSCTASFCTDIEKARALYVYEPGLTEFYDTNDEITLKKTIDGQKEEIKVTPTQLPGYNNIYYYTDINFASSKMSSIIKNSEKNGYGFAPKAYWEAFDLKVVAEATNLYKSDHSGVDVSDYTVTQLKETVLKDYGYVKFLGTGASSKLFEWYDLTNKELAYTLGTDYMPTADFVSYYKSQTKSLVSNLRTCITTVTGEYGSFGPDGKPIKMEAQTWGDAWKKGVIEGLLVYPIAWCVDALSNAFGYHQGATTAVPQLLALLVVTVAVRLLLMLATIKSTINQQKMTALQPEIAKIQQKYPDSKTNRAQQARLAQEQQELYKKHKINPLSSLLVMFIQFPIFIGVWNGLSGSAVLSSGQLLGMNLSASIQSIITGYFTKGGFTSNAGGWWTALVLFILMGAAQIVSMRITAWMQKAANKKISKMGKNPAQTQNDKTMKIVSWVMVIFIIIMGFSLPSAMGVYWFVGALISIAQTVIMQTVIAHKNNNKKNKKKGAKK